MILFVYGTDNYQVSEKLQELKNGFIQKRDKSSLNVVNISEDKISTNLIKQEALTTPFLGEKKMIVVKNILKNKPVAKEIFEFLQTSENSIENIICFVDYVDSEYVKFDKKNKLVISGDLFKYLSSGKYVWEFNKLKGNDLNQKIKKYCNQYKIKIDNDAVKELIVRSGNDLYSIVNELSKLKSFKKEESISIDDIKVLVNNQLDDNIFDLVDAIGNKNKPLALKLISNQLRFGNHPILIVNMINRQFKIILKTKDKSANAKELKIHPFVFSKAKSQASNFTKEKIGDIINDITQIEKNLKSDNNNPELILDMFIAKNC